jgi:hypothetical protein
MGRNFRSKFFHSVVCGALFVAQAGAAAKPHVISLGKWTSVQWVAGATQSKPVVLKVRALMVDGRVKEYVLGTPHEVTDRLFVVRRVFRMNDSLPEERGNPRWQWERGGWLLVDRTTGRISPIVLPEFDAFYSAASWFRDYAAYCGVSDDGKKVYAIVAQLSRRKPVLKNLLAGDGVSEDGGPDSACGELSWQRTPVRVSFAATGGARQTFAIRGHVVDLVNDVEEEGESSK